MGNANTTPKKNPPEKKASEKKHKGLPRTAAAKKTTLKKRKEITAITAAGEKEQFAGVAAFAAARDPIAHVFPGPDRNTAIVCYRDPATGRYDLNCHPVPVSELGRIFSRRRG